MGPTVSPCTSTRGGEPPARPKRRASKLDPFRAQVDGLLEQGIWNAEVIHHRIRAAGYTGGRTVLRLYIQPRRALRPGAATVRYVVDNALAWAPAFDCWADLNAGCGDLSDRPPKSYA